ncbi:hypothetical protein F5880DRAFT_1015020 [Lentinula raphanica]|nr:hypothetical protein F5880DRAFT_1015020 [Lentinula raphanica]
MASTEMLKVTPDTAMSSSWSGESLSKWISLSNHGEEHTSSSARPGTEDQAVTSLHDDQSHSVQTAHYPSTHYSYSHPELNPTSYQLTLPAIQPSPLSEGTISPTSQSEVYISSSSSANITSSINGHNGVVPMSWNHAVPGPGLPDELSSPRGNPLYLPYSHPDASPSSPFLSAVHSPASGSPGTHMITLLPPAHSLPAHTERPPLPQEHYVNLSDVAGDTASTPQIHGYHPHHHHHNDSDNIVYGTLQDGSRFENKRAREEDYPEDHIVPNKRSRGRPRKNSIHMSNSNTSFSSGNRSSGDGTEDMGGDGDSDAYVPSRSTSPRARGRRSTKRVSDSSYESSGGEHYQDGTFSLY